MSPITFTLRLAQRVSGAFAKEAVRGRRGSRLTSLATLSTILATGLIAGALLAPSAAFAGGFLAAGNSEKAVPDVSPPPAPQDELVNPQVVPPQSRVGGKSYSEWAAAYTQWFASISLSQGVFDDGTFFALNQSGPVWYVQPGCTNRTYTLPAGKFLWAPIAFAWNEYPCPDPNFEPAPGQSMEDFLLEGLASFLPPPPADGSLLVDGEVVDDLAVYQATSGLFTVTFDLSWQAFDGCVTGGPQPCVAGGWYVMLKPMSVGLHTLEYPGCDVIQVNVVPSGHGRGDVTASEPPAAINWGGLKAIYR